MYILLFRTALLECFIYSRVKILRCAKIPVASTKNKVIAISVHLIRKKIPSFQIIYYLSKKSCLSNWFIIFFWLIEEIPSLTAFAREWKSIGLQNTSRLFLANISSKLSTINDYVKIPKFFIDKFSKFPMSSTSVPTTTFFIHISFLSSVKKIVNQIADCK